ncbi:MAG: hypothetical protein EA350_06815 [Gemmatimonadales bacterium]|nr:MAG: hypothetical protein EA350_06815 [Gemmatimonadales bacterium]
MADERPAPDPSTEIEPSHGERGADSPASPHPGRSPRAVALRAVRAPPYWVGRFRATLSIPGILVGTLFFAASLTPSLLPRGWVLQGILSGLCMTAGYGIGVGYRWLWGYLEFPLPARHTERLLLWLAAGTCAAVAIAFLWQASAWQNSVRVLMEVDPVDTARPIRVGLLGYLVFAVMLGFARLFHATHRLISARLGQGMPRRVANVVSVAMAAMLFWVVLDGVVLERGLRFADRTFQRLDAREEAETEAPTDPIRTGSPASLIAWEDLGRTGRSFVSGVPGGPELGELLREVEGGPDEIDDAAGAPVLEPIRVYVGLNAAETPGERAALALAELERVGAFDRSMLVIAVPTGTGWVDPRAMRTLEALQRGDVATVAIQYSYLPSWLTLLTDEAYGAGTADALFSAVYRRWTELPADNRPDLYLYGLSLGAHNSQQSADLYDVIGDPFHGALWVGPPFRSETWRDFVRQRDPGSPAWLPRFRDGSVVRFMNQWEVSHSPDTPWSPLRIVYLQYASDPITFFEPESFFRRPGWLEKPRGPDVSEKVRWIPVVTFLQLLGDLGIGDQAPVGYGHVYAAEHYIDAWVAVTDPPGWTEEGIRRLKEVLGEEGRDPPPLVARPGSASYLDLQFRGGLWALRAPLGAGGAAE